MIPSDMVVLATILMVIAACLVVTICLTITMVTVAGMVTVDLFMLSTITIGLDCPVTLVHARPTQHEANVTTEVL